MIHYDEYLERRRLAGAEGALELEAHRRRRVVVGRERAEFGGTTGVEVGSRILRVGVSVPPHPHVDVTWGGAALSCERESGIDKYRNVDPASWAPCVSDFSDPTTAGSSRSTPTANGDVLRRGAGADLMEQVGDALAAPRSAYVHVQRST